MPGRWHSGSVQISCQAPAHDDVLRTEATSVQQRWGRHDHSSLDVWGCSSSSTSPRVCSPRPRFSQGRWLLQAAKVGSLPSLVGSPSPDLISYDNNNRVYDSIYCCIVAAIVVLLNSHSATAWALERHVDQAANW